jgi:hypothetical protein
MKTNREILAKFISTEGYKRNSPDKNRPFNIIPSGNITMQDVDFPVKGVDNLGNEMTMMPGEEYTFPGDYVVETPAMQIGGQFDPVSTQGQEINFEQRKKQLEEKLKEEDLRVELVKGNVLTLALKALRDKEYKKQIFKTQLDEGSAYCSTRSCELERAAGYTVPKDVKVYGRNIPAGSKIPVIPGTSSFDRYAPDLGYKKIPIAELSPGDKMIDFYPGGAHSMIFSGDEVSRNSFIYDDGSGKSWKEGYYPIDDNSKHRYQGYRYVGNTINLQNELNDAQRGVDMFTSKNNNWDRYNEESKEQLNKIARVKKFPNGGQTGWLDNYQDGGPQMYPAPSLEFQKRVQDNIRRNQVQPTFVRREPVTVSQTDNTRTNAVENAKRDLESYTPQERAYFAQNNIPRDQWFSAKTKMQNDAVLKRREEVKRQAQADVRNNPFAITPATNEQLRNEFRAFPNDPNSFFDKYLNVPNHIGNFAASLGENFTGEQPFDPWKLATDVVSPAFVGMTAGIGAQNTGQFVNNLINPLAGIGNPLKRSVNITSSVDNVIQPATPNQPATPKPWQMQELPGLHLKSTMEGEAISKIIEPKTGLINTEQALAIIGKESGGADKVALIRQGLGDNIPQKMDYNDFRKTVQNQLIPLEKQFSTKKSDYGINRLGYNTPTRGGFDNRYVIKEAEAPIENQTLILGNKNKFGRGSDAHGNPEETLGHAHFLRDAETPDVLTVTQIQSDAFQGTYRIMPKDSKNLTALEKQQNSLARMEDLQERNKSILNKMKTEGVDEAGLPVQDYQIRQFEDIVKAQENANIFKKADIENFTQKQLLDKNHQERYLQELVDYAGKRGDVNKMRVPTSETAAKVQGYNPIQESTLGPITKKQLDESSTFEEFFTLKKEEIKEEIGDYELNSEEINTFKKIYNDYKAGKLGKVYDPAHTTILKKYEEQPKTIKKLFGKEPTIVTDSKGNTWYEFDIPEKFKKGKGEIKAFSMLPAIPAAGAVAGSVNNEKRDGGETGWLDKYK